MNDIDNAISRLEKQRSAIDRALLALREISGPHTPNAQPVSQSKSRKRRLSPEGRRRIIEATKRRWADHDPLYRFHSVASVDTGDDLHCVGFLQPAGWWSGRDRQAHGVPPFVNTNPIGGGHRRGNGLICLRYGARLQCQPPAGHLMNR